LKIHLSQLQILFSTADTLGCDLAQDFQSIFRLTNQHPMALFRILVLKNTSIRTGLSPKTSQAFATARATAVGSAQPMACVTSLSRRPILLVLSKIVCIRSKIEYPYDFS
jgi:hypothetical protein